MSARRVLAFVRELQDQARLRGALRGSGVLTPCATPNDVLAELARDRRIVAVVVTTYGPSVSDAISLTRVLHVRHPNIPVLLYFDAKHTNPRDLLELFHAGAAEIVQGGSDDLRRVFSTVLSTAGHRVNARRVMEALEPIVAPEARPILEYLLEKGDTPLAIEDAAAAVGLKRRTLEKRLAGLAYPPPETLIGWCRLLTAAHLLEDQTRTFDEVALQLDFPSGMALRSMLKRYTGVSGRTARAGNGPLALVLRHLTERLKTPQAQASVRQNRDARPRGPTRNAGKRHSTRAT